MVEAATDDRGYLQLAVHEPSSELAEAALRDLLGAFPHIRMSVTGACMAPGLAPGDTVHVARTPSRAPRFGDIVLRRHPAGLRLHRVVWGRPAAGPWRTRGDRSLVWDPPAAAEDVLGTVVWVEGKGRPGTFVPGCKALAAGLLARARLALRPSAQA